MVTINLNSIGEAQFLVDCINTAVKVNGLAIAGEAARLAKVLDDAVVESQKQKVTA